MFAKISRTIYFSGCAGCVGLCVYDNMSSLRNQRANFEECAMSILDGIGKGVIVGACWPLTTAFYIASNCF